MKVLLINPPIFHELTSGLPKLVEDESGLYPPLGLLYIASYLQKYSNHDVKLIDAPAEKLTYPELENIILNYRPSVVGITCTTFTMPDVLLTAKMVKKIDKDIFIAVGGRHVDIFPEETINLPEIDFVIIGEGELTFFQLIDFLEKRTSLESIPGLLFKERNTLKNTGFGVLPPLDELPHPDRKLIPYTKYYTLAGRKRLMTTIITNRGCPYNCAFCVTSRQRCENRSPKNILDEIEECHALGIEEFYFVDSTFNLNKNRVTQICEKMLERSFNINWSFRARVKPIDLEMLQQLKKTGCHLIQFGVESGTQEILEKMNKGISIDEVKKAFKLTQSVGISTMAYFMIGYPGESKEHIFKSVELAKSLNPNLAVFCIFVPNPGTNVYLEAIEKGFIENDYWREFAKNPLSDFMPPFWEKDLTRKELEETLKQTYKNFYFRPGYLFQNLIRTKSFTEFKYKIWGALKMIRDIFFRS